MHNEVMEDNATLNSVVETSTDLMTLPPSLGNSVKEHICFVARRARQISDLLERDKQRKRRIQWSDGRVVCVLDDAPLPELRGLSDTEERELREYVDSALRETVPLWISRATRDLMMAIAKGTLLSPPFSPPCYSSAHTTWFWSFDKLAHAAQCNNPCLVNLRPKGEVHPVVRQATRRAPRELARVSPMMAAIATLPLSSHLKRLDMGNKAINSDITFVSLLEVLPLCMSLSDLDLSCNNYLSVDNRNCAEALSDFLRSTPQLQRLDVSHCYTIFQCLEDGMRCLTKAVAHHPNLKWFCACMPGRRPVCVCLTFVFACSTRSSHKQRRRQKEPCLMIWPTLE